MAFPGGSDGKESACSVGDLGLIPRLGRSPEEGHGNPLQYFCLKNSMDRGAWQATVRGITESDTAERLTLFFLSITIDQGTEKKGTSLQTFPAGSSQLTLGVGGWCPHGPPAFSHSAWLPQLVTAGLHPLLSCPETVAWPRHTLVGQAEFLPAALVSCRPSLTPSRSIPLSTSTHPLSIHTTGGHFAPVLSMLVTISSLGAICESWPQASSAFSYFALRSPTAQRWGSLGATGHLGLVKWRMVNLSKANRTHKHVDPSPI